MTIKAGMLIGIAILLSVVFLGDSVSAYCAPPWQVRNATNQLDRATRDFQRVVRRETGRSPLSGRVHRLVRSVDDLQGTLGYGISCDELRNYFQDVSAQYHEVRRQLSRGYGVNRDPRIVNRWDRVENAYYAMRQTVYAGPEQGRGRDRERGGIYIPLPDFR